MDNLSPEARSLLDDARRADDPRPGDKTRVRAALALKLAAPTTTDPTPTNPQPQPPAEPTAPAAVTTAKLPFTLGLLPKIFLSTLALGVVAWFAMQNPPPPSVSATASTAAAAAAPAATAAASASATATATAASASASAEGSSTSTSTGERLAGSGVVAPGKGSGKEAPAGLDRELKLLAEARRAMRDGDTERALKLLEQHQSKHPGGALAEERAAARVLALCQSGKRDEARSEAARFLALHPSSPMAARVRGACP